MNETTMKKAWDLDEGDLIAFHPKHLVRAEPRRVIDVHSVAGRADLVCIEVEGRNGECGQVLWDEMKDRYWEVGADEPIGLAG